MSTQAPWTRIAPALRTPGALLLGVALLVSLGLLAVNLATGELRPGNSWGIGYGVAAAILLLCAGAYSWRRRAPRRGPASARAWLQFHLYGGALFLLMVLSHSGFGFPQGLLTRAMWILSFWLVLGGLIGVLIQRWIPRLLTSGLSDEVHFQRIPELVESIRAEAEQIGASAGEMLRPSYREHISPNLEKPRFAWTHLIDPGGGRRGPHDRLNRIRDYLSQQDAEKWDRLCRLLEAKRELDAHYTLQGLLRGWLYLHVPFSILLIVLVLFHIFTVVYY